MMAVLGLVVILAFSQDAVSRIFSYITYDIFVKQIFLVKHEGYLHRQHVAVAAHLVAEVFGNGQAGSILLCGDDAPWVG